MNFLDDLKKLEEKICNLIANSVEKNFAETDLTANGNRLHKWQGFDFRMQSLKNYSITSNDGNGASSMSLTHTGITGNLKNNKLLIDASQSSIKFESLSPAKTASLSAKDGGLVELFSTDGLYEIKNLQKLAPQNVLIGMIGSTGRLGYITMGDNISLIDGVLHGTPGESSGDDTNEANTNLVADANRTHNWNSYDLRYNNVKGYSVSAGGDVAMSTTEKVFLQSAKEVNATVGGKGLKVGLLGNMVLTEYPNTRNDGDTTKALYTDSAGNIRFGTVLASETANSKTDTNSIAITLSGTQSRQIQAAVKISADVGNALAVRADGLFSTDTGGGGGGSDSTLGNLFS